MTGSTARSGPSTAFVKLGIETAAAVIGIGRTLAYELVRRLRLGRRVVVPVPDLLRLFGAG